MPETQPIGAGTFPYLLFQFMPAILVGVFSLMSLLNQDIRALVYGVGLSVAAGAAFLLTQTIRNFVGPDKIEEWTGTTCTHAFTLANQTPFSIISMNLIVYAYTFAYLLTGMGLVTSIRENVPTIIFFTLLIAADIAWSATCYTDLVKGLFKDAAAIFVGGLIGAGWAAILPKKGNLLYLTGMGTRDTCTATRQKLRCVKKTIKP